MTKTMVNKIQKLFSIVTVLIFVLITSFSMLYTQNNQEYKNLLVPIKQPNPIIYYLKNTSDANDGTKIVTNEKNFKNYLERRNPKDTTKNKIKSLRLSNTGDSYLLYLELESYDYKIKISCYNMLGKKIFDAYEGLPYKDPDYYYEIPISNLPKGVYICIVQGRNFKIAEKFIVSR